MADIQTEESIRAAEAEAGAELLASEAPLENSESMATSDVESNGASTNGTSLLAEDLKAQLEQTQKERDDAKHQLEGIIGKLSGMKTMFQNYKAVQGELDELKEQSTKWDEAKEQLETENKKLEESLKTLKEELSNLNGECDRLSTQDSDLRRELQAKDQELQDEKYRLEMELRLAQKSASGQKSEYSELKLAKEELDMENRNLRSIIDELKTKLADKEEDIQKNDKRVEELKADNEKTEEALRAEVTELKKEVEKHKNATDTEKAANEKLQEQLDQTKKELQLATTEASEVLTLKEEIHSKSIIIGKLRHEAIILNEHLTKSLGMLKQQLNNDDNTIDRELISNVILNFLQIPRGDAKKFEALQLISVLLEWDEHRKVQAGLSSGSHKNKEGESRTRNFVSLWTDFLEKESTKGNSGK
ncbi:hypothetical protein C7M61_002251 [Candidozyma pseudohaemuli]|uniref:GRIP domain-containing protein n=1 Tax=Candidozyma pseudohaemuli TaxID=418784 RepID=A0A2P7YSL1_9ASCO|nr:hypothetical protein C7M61_002251 [[Candida] pseudohaemulonii]PSK38945.1 hypothetical protein C7M61_002251 [[Candida] pseudohaemulonii]